MEPTNIATIVINAFDARPFVSYKTFLSCYIFYGYILPQACIESFDDVARDDPDDYTDVVESENMDIPL